MLEERWRSAEKHRLEARQDESQHRREASDRPLREQLDYSAYINGFV